MNQEFIRALDEIEKTKGISKDIIFDALEKALVKSYEKNFNDCENVKVTINRENGKIKVFSVKKVVENPTNDITEISLEEAQKIRKTIKLDDEISIEVKAKNFGRIAASTAKNIVIQQIKDAEKEVIYEEFIDLEKEIITGIIQRIDRGNLYIDLGRTEGIVPKSEQVPTEEYNVQDRLKLFVKEVKNTTKGAQIVLSRTDEGLVKRLLELEIPEISEGVVEVYSIAREAGSRTKLAVYSKEEGADPVGACVGFKGARVKAIVDELKGEKLDVIVWDKDIKKFLANSLAPSDVIKVFADEKEKTARVIVPENQLSLAIGKEGQNARLAAKLTGWKVDIKGYDSYRKAYEDGSLNIMFEEEKDYLENEENDKEVNQSVEEAMEETEEYEESLD